MDEWVAAETIKMIQALLGPLPILAKSERTEYTAPLTKTVPQRVPSLPALFNSSLNSLAMSSEASECIRNGNGGVFMIADDVLIQAQSQQKL